MAPHEAPGGVTRLQSLDGGQVTVFLARATRRHPGPRTPVVTLEAPALLALGAVPEGWTWVLGPSLTCELTDLDAGAVTGEHRAGLRRTVEVLGRRLQPAAPPPGEQVVRLGPRPAYVGAGRVAMVDAPSWARAVEGAPRLLGVDLPASGAPLPARLAMVGGAYTVAAAVPLDEVDPPAIGDGLAWLFARAADEAVRGVEARDQREAVHARGAPAAALAAEAHGVRILAAELGDAPPPSARHTDPLVSCVAAVAAHGGCTVVVPAGGLRGHEGVAAVRAIALASRLYSRRVRLVGRWWERSTSAVLAFRPDGTPVALLPEGGGMVAMTADGTRRAVDPAVAGELLEAGFVLTRPLDDVTVDRRALLAPAWRGRGRQVRSYLGWGLVVALPSLAVPLAAGVVFGEIIPESDLHRLWMLLGVLITVALATLPLQLVFSVARTRMEAPAAFDVQRGLWGRLLRSPSSHVRRIGPGELAGRMGSLEAVRDPIDSSVLAQLPTLLAGLLAGALLFSYDVRLALVTIAAGLSIFAVVVAMSNATARHQRDLDIATGRVGGFLLQVLVAIPKLRVASAESRAFLAWSEQFRDAVGQKLARGLANQAVVTGMIPTLGALSLLAGAAAIGPEHLDVGAFLAFQTTFGIFVGGLASTATAAAVLMQVRPAFDGAVDLAAAPLETSPDRSDPGPLRGSVAFADVTFRYLPTSRPVLDGLDLRVEAGEMVAIAGHSGSGKSTIMRLLLGFEIPEHGSVLFDDQDLTSLDVEAVRRQLGVVLQDGQLIPGTVHENIAGVATLSERESWELAELVALAEDIRAMPMGMNTVVTLNGGAFSGGQRQRLLIARALAPRPRVLLLDEATSALDNVTQRVITHNLAQLGMTRIVVAHRLSTMADANRILVLEGGRVVEEGHYEDLMALGGRFHALATRQVI